METEAGRGGSERKQTAWLILSALLEEGCYPGKRFGRAEYWGIPKVFRQLFPPRICLCHHDNRCQQVSRDSLTPGEAIKHHLHYACCTAHHCGSTRFLQSADMLQCWELWSGNDSGIQIVGFKNTVLGVVPPFSL